MNLLSFAYALLVVASAAVFWAVPVRLRPYVLLGAAAVYCTIDGPIAGVAVLLCALLSWLAGLASLRRWKSARWIAVLAVLGPLSTVAVDKLVNSGVNPVGVQSVGVFSLSYFTFQAIAYAVDVRRNDVIPVSSPVTVINLVSFFPHLAAGPVMAPRRVLKQFDRLDRPPTAGRFAEGVELVIIGLVKKVALSAPFIELIKNLAITSSTQTLLVGLGSALAAYLDITAYLDIARGVGKFYGLELPVGFAQPLTRSRSITDYWRRWNIPLMSWFRNYVYRPIIERMPGRLGRVLGVGGVFLAAGLWHGITTFWVLWGVVTAALILADGQLGALGRTRSAAFRRQLRWIRRLVVPLYFFGMPMLSFPWERFDPANMGARASLATTSTADLLLSVALMAAFVVGIERYEHRRALEGESRVVIPTAGRGALWGLGCLVVVLFSAGQPGTFIYQGF